MNKKTKFRKITPGYRLSIAGREEDTFFLVRPPLVGGFGGPTSFVGFSSIPQGVVDDNGLYLNTSTWVYLAMTTIITNEGVTYQTLHTTPKLVEWLGKNDEFELEPNEIVYNYKEESYYKEPEPPEIPDDVIDPETGEIIKLEKDKLE